MASLRGRSSGARSSPGKTPADAAVREVKEETDLRIRAAGLIGRRGHPDTEREMVYLAARPTSDLQPVER